MKPSQKRYILDHKDSQSAKEIAEHLGLRERNVKKIIEELKSKPVQQQEDTVFLGALDWHKQINFYLLLVGVGFCVYINSLGSSFHFDDYFVIIKNPFITNLGDWGAIMGAFNTRFVVGLTLAFNYALGKLNPSGYHAFNLAIHILNALLAFTLVKLTLSTPKISKQVDGSLVNIFSLFGGLVFLTHPIQSQAVNYIWQRAAVLAAFFALATLASYVYFRISKQIKFFFISLFFCAVGMFSKETMLTVPLALLLFEALFFSDQEDWKKLKPWIILAPFLLTMTIIPAMLGNAKNITLPIMRPKAVMESSATGDIDVTRFVNEREMKRGDYYLTQPNVVKTYLRLLVFPVNQNLDYDYPVKSSINIETVASSCLIFFLIAAAITMRNSNPLFCFGTLWMFLALSLESLIVQNDVIYEHRLYLPVMGFILSVIAILIKIPKLSLKIMLVVVIIVSIALSYMTLERNKVWKSEVTLWGDVIKKSPNKPRGYHNLSAEMNYLGKENEAIQYGLKAIAADDRLARKNNGLYAADAKTSYLLIADIYRKQMKLKKATYYYKKGLRVCLNTKENPYRFLTNLANLYGGMGQTKKAMVLYERSMSVAPDKVYTFYNAGTFYLEHDYMDKAILAFHKALEIDPENFETMNNLANAYYNTGRFQEAKPLYEKAILLNPQFEVARENLKQVQKILDKLSSKA